MMLEHREKPGSHEERATEPCTPAGREPSPGAANWPLGSEVLRNALDQAYDAVAITANSPSGPVIVYVNAAFMAMTGYAADEMIGKSAGLLAGPKTDRESLELLASCTRRGLPCEGRAIHYRKDGSEFWLEWRSAPVRDEAGRVTHYIAILRDVTNLKHAEEERQRAVAAESQRLLERESVARAHAETAQAQLQLNDQMKDEFLAMLAHELRNPLASIAMAAQLLDQGAPAASRASAIIERQTNRLSRLADDLLDVARVTSGTIELRKQRIDLRQLVTEIVDGHRAAVEARKHQLHTQLVPEPLFVNGDGARLSQAVSNLLSNAIRYTPDGGQIEVTLERDAGLAVLKIRDTGVGIPKHMLDKIFETFQQVDRGITRVQGGLGLGLTLTRRLVELHGGSIVAESAGLGQGSEFTIRLPEYDAAAAGKERVAARARAEAVHKSLRILVVEDNPDVRDALVMLLSARGHTVRAEEGGQRAIELAPQFQPDIVLLDIGLPEMDGYEVARRLRANGLTRARLVALTGYGSEQERELSHAAGFDTHLIKPVAPDALERELENARHART